MSRSHNKMTKSWINFFFLNVTAFMRITVRSPTPAVTTSTTMQKLFLFTQILNTIYISFSINQREKRWWMMLCQTGNNGSHTPTPATLTMIHWSWDTSSVMEYLQNYDVNLSCFLILKFPKIWISMVFYLFLFKYYFSYGNLKASNNQMDLA